jgi:hypothetical protein
MAELERNSTMGNGTRERALCCECGNLRTVSVNYSLPHDVNRSYERDPFDKRGWRVTGTLKCCVCKTKTRHALLRDNDKPEHRDIAERLEHERHALIRQQAQVRRCSDEELRQEAQRRIRNIMGVLCLRDLTLPECGDLLGLLNEIIDRRGGVL